MFNEKNNEKKLPVNLQFALDESMDLNYNARKNFGYAALSKIYHELEIDKFLRNRQRHSNEEYDANAIMKLLVFSRLLYPLLRKRLLKTKMFSLISLIFHWMMCIDVLLFSTSIVMLYNFGSMSILSLCMIGIQIWFIMMLLTITLRLMNRMNFEKKGFLKSIGLKNLVFDADTGEISESVRQHLIFDEEKLREEEKFDGYYAIVTSEYKETPEKIIDMYRGLWKIEESFKVTKSDFESRPVYLSLKEHIDAHFLICFIALVIVRVLEYRLKGKYSVTEILESLGKACCSYIKENYYLFDFCNNVLEDTGKD